MSENRGAPEGADASKPNSARMFDYLLGGKDNYEIDRMAVHAMLAVAPDTRTLAWFSRQFLLKAVQIAAESGVRQFIDLGAGIPTSPAVHEVAQKVDSSARVVSIDFDPVVQVHATAMLSGIPGVTPMLADARKPDDIIARLRADRLIDFDRPVAVLMVGLLHFVMDEEHPAEIVARFREVMAPGSYLAFTHGGDESDPAFIQQTVKDTGGSTAHPVYRSRAEVASFFEGFEMLGPGVVPLQEWLGGDLPHTGLVLLGGICRTPTARKD
ncbi:SAM-dependent methyltransferase [Nocardia transvalensis]|uniref:SAM-dependent methyltransferase n=1 Tax=Nocardia transvalensis TaxID=37333 RepID=UPI00189630E2|nr:SAM-dependent methyltransferase [Nocardia transvalensis]MBF6329335.1 SAM-dependent methyltransferase [Nocardia transvalensis]